MDYLLGINRIEFLVIISFLLYKLLYGAVFHYVFRKELFSKFVLEDVIWSIASVLILWLIIYLFPNPYSFWRYFLLSIIFIGFSIHQRFLTTAKEINEVNEKISRIQGNNGSANTKPKIVIDKKGLPATDTKPFRSYNLRWIGMIDICLLLTMGIIMSLIIFMRSYVIGDYEDIISQGIGTDKVNIFFNQLTFTFNITCGFTITLGTGLGTVIVLLWSGNLHSRIYNEDYRSDVISSIRLLFTYAFMAICIFCFVLVPILKIQKMLLLP